MSSNFGKNKVGVSGVARSTTLKKRIERSNSFELKKTAEEGFSYLAHSSDDAYAAQSKSTTLFICTGGGPGFMEAANRGAHDAGGKSIGMGITLPFEKGLNPYVTPELAFEYHYFFTRKFWMAYYMQALVVAPGGFGTCDELFEIVTLKQTGKLNKDIPIVLFGKQYWEDVVNWKALAKYGTISEKDIADFCFTDDVGEAFEFVSSRLLAGDAHIAEDVGHGE